MKWHDYPTTQPDSISDWPAVMVRWRWRDGYSGAFKDFPNHSNARYTDDGRLIVDEGELIFEAADAEKWEIQWAPL